MIVRGDARRIPLADGSVDLIVTSPAYWQQRDYGYSQQLGQESTVEEFINNLVHVALAECWEVLAPWGNLFVNLGDSYGGSGRWGSDSVKSGDFQTAAIRGSKPGKPGARALIPQRFAIAADAWGWTVRQEIIWRKPVGENSRCLNRVLTQHEQIWHLTKGPSHYPFGDGLFDLRSPATFTNFGNPPRSVWEINPEPITWPQELLDEIGTDGHFAPMPSEIVRRFILGWAPRQVCRTCNKPSIRKVERIRLMDGKPLSGDWQGAWAESTGANRPNNRGAAHRRFETEIKELGWSDCGHENWREAVVLDPFGGTGTTALVANALGRKGVSLDLSADYCRLAKWRCSQPASKVMSRTWKERQQVLA